MPPPPNEVGTFTAGDAVGMGVDVGVGVDIDVGVGLIGNRSVAVALSFEPWSPCRAVIGCSSDPFAAHFARRAARITSDGSSDGGGGSARTGSWLGPSSCSHSSVVASNCVAR
jgi:hypothetical protein